MSYQQRQQDLFKYRLVDYMMAVMAWAGGTGLGYVLFSSKNYYRTGFY